MLCTLRRTHQNGGTSTTQTADTATFVALLKTCVKPKDLGRGTGIHEDVLRSGLLEKCLDALVTMYAKCGALDRAKALIDVHGSKDVFTWGALIAECIRKGEGQDALHYFERMERADVSPDPVIYSYILKACGIIRALDKGLKVNYEIAEQGLLRDNVVLGTALVDMYVKCGDLAKAQQVLEELHVRNVISWTTLIVGYAEYGDAEQALNCYETMQHEGLSPNAVTFSGILKACGIVRAIDKGERIYSKIILQGLLRIDVVLGTALLNMYIKCGALAKAHCVLEELRARNVVSWNAVIAGYCDLGEGEKALDCLEQMQNEGLSPDTVTYTYILKVCACTRALEVGEKIHDEIGKQGLLGGNEALGTALVNLYARCGDFTKARGVMAEMTVRDVISWNALISGSIECGESEEALRLFEEMQREGLSPDVATYASILKACASIRAAEKGQKFHEELCKQGFLPTNVVLGNAVVDMYAKCGALGKARSVLDQLPVRNVISWNAVIAGCVDHGEGNQAVNYFEEMQIEGVLPDAVTYTCILKACGSIEAAEEGERVVDEICKQGLLKNDAVLCHAVVDMCTKCGNFSKIQHLIGEVIIRDTFLWNALIAGCAEHGRGEQALALNYFEKMQQEGFTPDIVTYTCMLKSCGGIGAVNEGERIHEDIAKQGLLGLDIVLGNALVDMYAKCGVLAKARQVLEELPVRDVITWTALITGYAENGQGKEVLSSFEQMQQEGLSPNATTFSCVLNACSRLGLAEDAQVYLSKMSSNYGVEPELEHYTCMVDLFGRVGHFDKAIGVIEKIPSIDSAVWWALSGACKKGGDMEIGRWAIECAIHEHKSNAVLHPFVTDIFPTAGNNKAMTSVNEALEKMDMNSWLYISGSVCLGEPEQLHSLESRICSGARACDIKH